MLIKTFYILLNYINFITCFNHTGPFSGNNLFQGIYRTAHNATLTLKYVIVFQFGVGEHHITTN
jgi:hypothetical protein